MAVSGSCLCGGVRFEVEPPFRRANHCHCSRCRKHSGAFGGTQGRVPREGFRLLQGEELISVTHQGYGKRTPLKDYPVKGRGGKGVIGHTLTKKTGLLAGAFVGSKDQDMFVISSSGIVIRVAAADIRRVGRASQGVRTMRVEEGATVSALAPVIASAEVEVE